MTNKADAKALWAALADQVQQIAEVRQATGDQHMPDDIRALILRIQDRLRKAGLSQTVIYSTPGLEPLPAVGPAADE